MYTNFLRSLTAVIFSHVFASSLILIFVALYQAECYAALPFVHLLLESNFLPIYLYTYLYPATSFYENRMLRVFTHRMSYCSTVTFIIGRCKPGVVFALISYFFLCFSLLDMEASKIRIRCILSALLT